MGLTEWKKKEIRKVLSQMDNNETIFNEAMNYVSPFLLEKMFKNMFMSGLEFTWREGKFDNAERDD